MMALSFPLQEQPFVDFSSAFEKGDAVALAGQFGDLIDLKVDSKKTNYSKNQAQFIMGKFFKDYPPKAFVYSHSAKSPDKTMYALANYTSDSGSRFDIYVIITLDGDVYKVQSLSITKS